MKRRLLALTMALLAMDAGAKDRSSSKYDKASKSDRTAEKAAAKAEKSSRSEPAPGPVGPAGGAQNYEAYRYVRTRNIFDPTRRGLRLETPPSSGVSSATRRDRTLALTGTMVTVGKSLAFFGGAENRVIGVGESVANFKVTKINATQVSLEHDGKALLLDVGRQIALEGGDGPSMIGPQLPEPIVTDAPPAMPGMPPPPGGGGDKNEVLRRMMERRAAEVGK